MAICAIFKAFELLFYLLWGPGTSYGTYNPADLPTYGPTSKSMETLHDRSIPKQHKSEAIGYRGLCRKLSIDHGTQGLRPCRFQVEC